MKKHLMMIMLMIGIMVLGAGLLAAEETEANAEGMKTFSLSVGAGMRNIGDNLYKEVYDKGGVFYFAEAAYRVAKPAEIFVRGEMFKKDGETTYTKEPTTLKITPLQAGVRLLIAGKKANPQILPYLGGGVSYNLIKEENIIGTYDEKKLGFFAEGGLRFYVMDSIFIDAKGKFDFLKIKMENVEINLGGFIFMGGVGISL